MDMFKTAHKGMWFAWSRHCVKACDDANGKCRPYCTSTCKQRGSSATPSPRSCNMRPPNQSTDICSHASKGHPIWTEICKNRLNIANLPWRTVLLRKSHNTQLDRKLMAAFIEPHARNAAKDQTSFDMLSC